MTSNGELDELLARHEPALRRLAASYERDPALREDLVQEMLFALFRALPAWRHGSRGSVSRCIGASGPAPGRS